MLKILQTLRNLIKPTITVQWLIGQAPELCCLLCCWETILHRPHISAHLSWGGMDRFCSELSFQGCLSCEHPWKAEIPCPARAEGKFVLLSSIRKMMSPSGADFFAVSYKRMGFPKLGVPQEPHCVSTSHLGILIQNLLREHPSHDQERYKMEIKILLLTSPRGTQHV